MSKRQTGGDKRKNNIVSKVKSNKLAMAVSIASIVSVMIGLFNFIINLEDRARARDREQTAINESVKISSTYLIPYFKVGQYVEELDLIMGAYIDTNDDSYVKACKALVYFMNNTGNEVRMTDAKLKLDSLEKIEAPLLAADAKLFGDHIEVCLLNNGWGRSDDIKLSVYGKYWPNGKETLVDLNPFTGGTELYVKTFEPLDSGEIIRALSIPVNDDDFVEYMVSLGSSGLEINAMVESGSEKRECYLGDMYYIAEQESLVLVKGFGGGVEDDIVRNIIIDIDKPFEELSLFPDGNTPMLTSRERLTAMVIPTRSCKLGFSLSFEIDGGKWLSTDVLYADIIVPVYDDEYDFEKILDIFEECGLSEYTYGQSKEIQAVIAYDPVTILQ